MLPDRVTIIDVGLRDGLQNEATAVDTAGKLRLARALIDAGVRELEVTSFVRPDRVPRMADAEAVVAGLRHVIFVLAATDAFNERNVGRPVSRSIDDLLAICRRGLADGIAVRSAIAVAFGCPFSGPVATRTVLEVTRRCVAAGARAVDIADTIGVANPRQVAGLFSELRRAVPEAELAAHFHDTRGMGLANVWAAATVGIDRFDASIAGLGGCPFAPGATGNIATEDTMHLLEEAGIATGIDRGAIFAAADVAEELVGRPSAGRVKKAERAAAARVA
ncbi:MAG TPA: hydroxymethylglutaryl-CoA lyase [Candidatus Limnocylindria bacterium]